MKILCAPDTFKETLTATAAAEAMAAGIAAVHPDARIDTCPLGDGGDGTVDALVAALHGEFRFANVVGPLGNEITARFGWIAARQQAIVGLADASGLALVPQNQRDPTRTTTFGTGQLIRHAIGLGAREVLVCIGGSATTDGGAGLAQAAGVVFYDRDDQRIAEPLTGGLLTRISRWEVPPGLPRIRVACDVRNPLTGPRGAAAVYGPQKGATPEHVIALDGALEHLASLGSLDPQTPGFGAAGGAGYGLAQFLNAALEPGIDLVMNAVRFDERCRGVDLVMTGEGRLDGQSLEGKTTLSVARRAAGLGVPAIALVGSKGTGWEQCIGKMSDGLLVACHSLEERFGRERAMREASIVLPVLAAEAVGAWIRRTGIDG